MQYTIELCDYCYFDVTIHGGTVIDAYITSETTNITIVSCGYNSCVRITITDLYVVRVMNLLEVNSENIDQSVQN